ncbi:MAG: ABC transporter permease [Candidatus Marinimicrobia bacterium]|nr:ABC transporter permease [Candidatus Neomarinimicrobiota bacterium]
MQRIFSLFKKDMLLGIKDVFVILEVAFAVVIMFMLLFIFPKDIKKEAMIYIYDETGLVQNIIDQYSEDMELDFDLDMFVDNREDMITGITKNKNAMGVIISYGDETLYKTEMLVQPYTTEAMMKYVETEMEDMLSILHPPFGTYPLEIYNSVRITALQEGLRDELPFNKRMLPPIIMMMVGIIGMFAMVSLIGQERSDATIRAFRVTPAGLWEFIFSKHLMLLTVSIVTFSILYIPVIGGFHGYLPSLLIILLTVILGSTIGIILGSFFDNPMASMGLVVLLMLVVSLPAISLFAPVFSPIWLKFIPSYYTLFGLDAAMFPDNNAHIIWQSVAILGAIDVVFVSLSTWIFSTRLRKEA